MTVLTETSLREDPLFLSSCTFLESSAKAVLLGSSSISKYRFAGNIVL